LSSLPENLNEHDTVPKRDHRGDLSDSVQSLPPLPRDTPI
jgi:hypothetical protein